MKLCRDTLRLYAVTDRAWTTEDTPLIAQIEAALRGGVSCLQLREKDLSSADFLAEAVAVRELCRRYGVPLIINDDVDVAVKSGVGNVHIGQGDMSAAEVRGRIGDNKILGVSAHTVEQAVAAEKAGADYLGVGAVFATSTKADAAAVSLDTLKAICGAVAVPVVAIGGITKENLPLLKGSGIAGVALVSAIFAHNNIEGNCRELSALLGELGIEQYGYGRRDI